MGRKFTVSYEERVEAVEKYLRSESSINDLAKQLRVGKTTIRQWLTIYHSLGLDGLIETRKNVSYSSELKESAVIDYLSGSGSYRDICIKYAIKSSRQLRAWISKYSSHEELKSSGTGGVPIMTKGRRTSCEERVEIVKYCIEQKNNYAETAQKYQVSYQQVYSWTTKYEGGGVEALQDKRGKRKHLNEMSEFEKLKAENKLLEAKNKKQQMEIDFLKKLDEIERWRF